MEHTAAPSSDTTAHEASATGLRRSMFERRNRFTLRLGRRTAIPVILALHDPKSFNEVIFQTILSLMKDKIIKYLQYDPYHGQLRVVSDLPSPHSPIQCTELQSAHQLTLLYYFTAHEPPAFVVRNTSLTVLRAGPALSAVLPNKASEGDSTAAEQLDEDEEHVSDDERSWHSLHANDEDEEDRDEYNDTHLDDDSAHELMDADIDDDNNNHNDYNTNDNNNHNDYNTNDNNNHNDYNTNDNNHDSTDDQHTNDNNNNNNHDNHHDNTNDVTDDQLARDWLEDEEHVAAQAPESSVHHVRGYESVRLLSHVLVLETVSSEHSLTHLLSQQSRDSSPPPVHQLSRYFQQATPTKKRKSAGKDSTRGRKKAKK